MDLVYSKKSDIFMLGLAFFKMLTGSELLMLKEDEIVRQTNKITLQVREKYTEMVRSGRRIRDTTPGFGISQKIKERIEAPRFAEELLCHMLDPMRVRRYDAYFALISLPMQKLRTFVSSKNLGEKIGIESLKTSIR